MVWDANFRSRRSTIVLKTLEVTDAITMIPTVISQSLNELPRNVVFKKLSINKK